MFKVKYINNYLTLHLTMWALPLEVWYDQDFGWLYFDIFCFSVNFPIKKERNG
jgi:hypothetical protein